MTRSQKVPQRNLLLLLVLALAALGLPQAGAAAPSLAPVIYASGLLPAPDSTVPMPSDGLVLGCTIYSTAGISAWTVFVDNVAVPAAISGGPQLFQLRAKGLLVNGPHRIVVQAADLNGLPGGYGWTFTVAGAGPQPTTVAATPVPPTPAPPTPLPPPSGPLPDITLVAPALGVPLSLGPLRVGVVFRSDSTLVSNEVYLDNVKLALEGGGPNDQQETLFGEVANAPGLHTLRAESTDVANRRQTRSWEFLTVGTEGEGTPRLTTLSPLPGVAVIGGQVRLSARLESAAGVQSVDLRLDGRPVNITTQGDATRQTITSDQTNQANGWHYVTLRVQDRGGRSNSTAWYFYVGTLTTNLDRRYFPETGQSLSGPIRRYWEAQGTRAIPFLGYPLSGMISEIQPDGKAYTVQYFERARLEYHPENAGTPYEVQRGLLGVQFHHPDAPLAPPPPDRTTRFFPETGHLVKGAFYIYWNTTGGVESYGYPISEEFQERNEQDGKTYIVQYFQRARFEYHPENAGTPYEVLLGQLGRKLYNQIYPNR